MHLLEIAICVKDRGAGRAQAGDIIEARVPRGVFGRKEQANVLWLLVETNKTPEELKANGGTGSTRKRKCWISIRDLLSALPKFDKASITEEALNYQPGFEVDQVTGKADFVASAGPFKLELILREKV